MTDILVAVIFVAMATVLVTRSGVATVFKTSSGYLAGSITSLLGMKQ